MLHFADNNTRIFNTRCRNRMLLKYIKDQCCFDEEGNKYCSIITSLQKIWLELELFIYILISLDRLMIDHL